MVNDVELSRQKSRIVFIALNALTDVSLPPREGGSFAVRTGNHLIFLAT
jgi:hypothetical protein